MQLTACASLLLCVIAVAHAEFFCSPIWGTNANGVNGGRPRWRVSARYPADVARMNAQVAARGITCHINCNSTETRFIWFQYSNTSYPFIMDGTCARPNAGEDNSNYDLTDLDRVIGNGVDLRCGHHRGIGHDAGYYSIVEENCQSKIAIINAFARTPVPPTTARPTNAPTNPPTTRPTLAPSTRPTSAPTTRPTSAPTPHPCNDGSHGCDPSTTQCFVLGGNNYRCGCLPGFQNMPGSTTSCMTMSPTFMPTMQPTMRPTQSPTQSPTSRPTMDPCSPGQNACDPVSTTCANDGLPPYYTCLCNGLAGYIPMPNADPQLQRRCIMTPQPTAPPTFMPTMATTAAPGNGMGKGGVNAGSSTSDSGSGSSSTLPIVIIVVVVLIIVVGAVLYTRKGSSGGGGGGAPASGPVAFENPMYGDAVDDDNTGTDNSGGYMDVQGAADDV